MNRLTKYCLSIPFIVLGLSTVCGFALLYITGEPYRPYERWVDGIEMMPPLKYKELFTCYLVFSGSLFTCCLNGMKKIRQNGFLSFLTFFWQAILIVISVKYILIVLFLFNFYILPFVIFHISSYIWFRMKIKEGYFETTQIITNA